MKANITKKAFALILSLSILVAVPAIPASATEVPRYGNCGIGADEGDLSAGESTQYYIFGPKSQLTGVNASWSVSNASVASIAGHGDHATLTVKKNNSTVTVRATLNGTTLTDEYETAQSAESATSVRLNTNSATITGKGNTARVTAHIYPDDGKMMIKGDSLPAVISSNSRVATGSLSNSWNTEWSGGYVVITAHGSGSATITVKCSSGPSASCHVSVNGISGTAAVSTRSSTPSRRAASVKSSSVTRPFLGGPSSANTIQGATTQNAASNTASGSLTTASATKATNTVSAASGANKSSSSNANNANAALVISSANSGTSGTTSNTDSSAIPAVTNKKPVQQDNTTKIVIICIAAAAVAAVVAVVLVKRAKAKKDNTNIDDTRPL